MSAPILLVTGTDTDIGKTVATAAVAAALKQQGMRVAVIKPAQTGLQPGEPGDVAEVQRLAGADIAGFEFVRLPDPLAPDAAARLARMELPAAAELAQRIADVANSGDFDTVLVEGAGGLLVHLDSAGRTLADVGIRLRDMGFKTGFLLVVAARLGTLNVTQLSAEALDRRGLDLVGFIIGSYPDEPDLAEHTNIEDLPVAAGAPCLGQIPAGAASLTPERFQAEAVNWVKL